MDSTRGVVVNLDSVTPILNVSKRLTCKTLRYIFTECNTFFHEDGNSTTSSALLLVLFKYSHQYGQKHPRNQPLTITPP